jgi:predicted dehydrogenase
LEKINIGIIGLGERGYSLLKSVILEIDYVDVLGVCDIYEDRTERGFDIVAEKRGNKPVRTNDYKVLLGMPEIDAIVITSAWNRIFKLPWKR